MPRRAHVRYFADENALGLAKLLLRDRDDIVHPGHPLLPEVPLGTPDLEWLPVVARLRLIVITGRRRNAARSRLLQARAERARFPEGELATGARLSAAARVWLADLDASPLATSTKQLYRGRGAALPDPDTR